MLELTRDILRQRLDAFGPPRHLEPRREITLEETRRFLRHLDSRARIAAVASRLRLRETTVERVWLAMLQP